MVERIKSLEPDTSNRQIAKMLGVDESTIRADSAGNPAPAEKKTKKNKAAKEATAGNPAPSVSGAQAAKIVERKEQSTERQARKADLRRSAGTARWNQ
jgi:transposase